MGPIELDCTWENFHTLDVEFIKNSKLDEKLKWLMDEILPFLNDVGIRGIFDPTILIPEMAPTKLTQTYLNKF